MTLSLDLDIQDGWHVNSSRPTLPYLIPTKVELPEAGGLAIEDVAYPDGKMVELKFAKERLSVYEGRTTIHLSLRPPADAARGAHEIRARLTYQACSNTACLAPETVEFRWPVTVNGEPIPGARAARPEIAAEAPPAAAATAVDNPIARLLAQRRLFSVLIFVFLGGLALNLTPCVYPMIPVTIGFFGNQAADAASRSPRSTFSGCRSPTPCSASPPVCRGGCSARPCRARG
jgi:thiol:disulfide interchange protein DsbD